MCYFITATLPPGADADAIRPIAKRFGRGWMPLPGCETARKLRAGETYYLVTRNGCDCETGLGIVRRWGARDETDRKADAYKRRGWSGAKIERALAQRDAVCAQRSGSARHVGEKDAKRWLDFLCAAVGSGLTPSLGLLLHFYDGGLDEADFVFAREAVSLAKMDATALLNMEEDRLYEFFP